MGYQITESNNLLHATFFGVVSDAEFSACAREVREIASRNPTIDELVDLTRVTEFHVATTTICWLATDPPLFNLRSRQVFVAPDEAVHSLLRIYFLLLEFKRPGLHIFRTMDEALHWLGLSGRREATSVQASQVSPCERHHISR